MRDQNQNLGGTVFADVAELDNGLIVAVGTDDYMPNNAEGLISVFTGTGMNLTNQKHKMKNSHEFFGVCANGYDAIITGWFDNGDSDIEYKSCRIMSITPSSLPNTGSVVNWSKYYHVTGTNGSNNVNLKGAGLSRVYIRTGKIIAEGWMLDAHNANTENTQLYFECDLMGNSPSFRALRITNSFVNNTGFYPLDDKRLFTAQNPATSFQDANIWVNSTVYSDAVLSDVSPFTNTSPTLSKRFSITGNQSIFDLDMKGNLLYRSGAISGGGLSDNDIYYIVSAQNMQTVKPECILQDETSTIVTPTSTAVTPAVTTSALANNVSYDLGFTNPGFSSVLLCGDTSFTPTDPSACDLQCYWRVDGNTINTANFLGTLNKDDIRFKTNGNQVAVLDWKSGNFGLNTPAPNARLHVLCSPKDGPSDVRFEKLGSGKGKVLVIDDMGYVYQSENLEAKQAAVIDSLSKELSELKRMVYNLAREKQPLQKGGILLSPNPATNLVDITLSNYEEGSNAFILLYNHQGQLLSKQRLIGRKQTIDVSGLSSGNYQVVLSVNEFAASSEMLTIIK